MIQINSLQSQVQISGSISSFNIIFKSLREMNTTFKVIHLASCISVGYPPEFVLVLTQVQYSVVAYSGMVMETICYLPQNSVPDLNQAITPSGAYQLSYFFAFFHLNMQTHVCVWAVRIGYYRSRKNNRSSRDYCQLCLQISTQYRVIYHLCISSFLHNPNTQGEDSFVLSHNVVAQDFLTTLFNNHATNSRKSVTTPQNYLRHLGSVTRGIVNVLS